MSLVDDLRAQQDYWIDQDGNLDAEALAAYLIRRGVGKRGGRRRSRRERPECPELGKAAQRFAWALVARAGEGDTEALEELAKLQRSVDEAILEAACNLFRCDYSWGDIGGLLGITKQAARQRFGKGV